MLIAQEARRANWLGTTNMTVSAQVATFYGWWIVLFAFWKYGTDEDRELLRQAGYDFGSDQSSAVDGRRETA